MLIHDAMYSEAEYEEKHGWGHSTFQRALDVAVKAEVSRLFLFHHSPERPDSELAVAVAQLQEFAASEGYGVEVDAAREGASLTLEGSEPG